MRVIRIFNILSLDVSIGAVICAIFFSRMWNVPINWLDMVLLMEAVWLIYTFDHLKDAYDIRQKAGTFRHAFHQQHFNGLILMCIIVLLSALCLLIWVDAKTLRMGSILLGLVATYFLALHFLPSQARYHKEIMIASLYALGVGLSPVSKLDSIHYIHVIYLVQFMLLALGNLFIFSWFEYDKDMKSGFPSMVQPISYAIAKKSIKIFLFVLAMLCLLGLVITGHPIIELTYLAMTILLYMIISYSTLMEKREYYRLLGDGIFLLPAVVILIEFL